MKSERRHELQQNALRNELLKTWDFIRAKGNYIAWGVLIVAVVIFAVFYFVKSSREKAARQQANYVKALAEMPGTAERLESLKAIADADSPEWLVAAACVEVGNDYSYRLVSGWDKMTEPDRKQLADNARAYYNRVLEKFSREELAVAKARLGLGKLAESFREFDAAGEQYQKIRQMTSLTGNPILQVAEENMSRLAEYSSSKIRMATTMPAEEPATQPTTQPTTGATTEPTTAPATAPATRVKPRMATTIPVEPTMDKPAATTAPAATKPAARATTAEGKDGGKFD